MSDAKELVGRLNTALKYVIGWNTADQRAARQAVNDARDWIERWAPVEVAARADAEAVAAVQRAYEKCVRIADETSEINLAAADRVAAAAGYNLRQVLSAALRENKPSQWLTDQENKP